MKKVFGPKNKEKTKKPKTTKDVKQDNQNRIRLPVPVTEGDERKF